jgi:O-antigen/teichoic acid export membrane protein
LFQKISYNLGIAAISRFIVGAIGLVVIGFLTRSLGPAGYGYYNLIFAYLFIFSTVADLGLYTILVREISKVDSGEEKIIASKLFTLRFIVAVLVLIAADLLVFALPYPFLVKLGILIASLFSIFSSLTQVLTGIFQKHLRLYLVSFADVISRASQLALLIVLIYLKAGLLMFVGAAVFSEIIHFLLTLLFSKSLTRVGISVDFKYWGETLKIALPIAASLVFVLIYFKLDTVLLSLMKPAYDVGVYSIAYKILEAVIFLPAIYVGLVMPLLSRHAFGDRPEFIKTFRKAFNVLSVFALPLAAYIFVLSGEIIRIVGGSGFAPAGPVLKILSIAILMIFFGNLGGNAIVALNLQKKGMWIYLAGAVFNVVANLILIPRYSYFATAWTTVATEILITFWMFWLIKKETGTAAEKTIFPKAILASAIMLVIMWPFFGNFVLATAAAVSYFPILFLLGGFTKDDLREIFSLKKTPAVPEEIESQ